MPRITITVTDETLAAMDDFAEHLGKSRSAAIGAILDMMKPMIGDLKTVYSTILAGDPNEINHMVEQLGGFLDVAQDEYESLRAGISGASGSANPRSCNNGGQVSPTDSQDPTHPLVFLGKKPLTPPPGDQGGKNA